MSTTSQDDIKTEITALAEKNTWWSTFVGSQFIAMLATYLAQLIYRCYQYAASALAESFISTATNRASILAAAETVGYIGERPQPSTGSATLTNKTSSALKIPQYTTFVSDDELPYLTTEVCEIAASGSAAVAISQLEIVEVETSVSTASEFMEVPLSKDLTAVCHKVEVIVTTNGTASTWSATTAFRLASSTSEVYVLFYKANDQLGVRFGDGTIGKIPPVDSTITLRVWCTNGDTTLLSGQTLTPSDDSADLSDSISAATSTSVTGGSDAESIEVTRQRTLYYTAYDDQVAWQGDYSYYLVRNISGLGWVKAWGEGEQETLAGAMNLSYINKIFISGWHPSYTQTELETLILAALDNIPNEMNKRFSYTAVNPLPFTITLTGTISASLTSSTVESNLKTALETRFGHDSTYFDPKKVGEYILIKKKDLWAYIEGLGYFEDFSLEFNDWNDSNGYYDFVYLNVDDSTFSITYEE